MKAVIMAGGQGTRLRPLTCNIPKPMMPIMDKPVMEYAIELLKENGITDIAITLQYLSHKIIDYFGNGEKFGVNLTYFMEDNPMGTAGSVKNVENFLKDTFIVLSGDALMDIDISKVVAYHKSKKAIGTIVLKEVSVPLEYGVVITDKEGKVKGFLEKPSWSEVFSDKVNTGIYVLEPKIFEYYEQNERFDFSNDLFPILLNNNETIYGYAAQGYWCDIGNIRQYMKCHFDILKGLVKVKIKGQKYRKGIWLGENCEISTKAKIQAPSYIGSNTKICSSAKIDSYTVLGKDVVIYSNTKVEKSIVFDNCYLGESTRVNGAVLCGNVHLEGQSEIFEGAVIGEDSIIGSKAIIKSGVKIWPNKSIKAGSLIKSNVIWEGKFFKGLFGKKGISGEINLDITPEFVCKLGLAYGSVLKGGSRIAISCSDDEVAEKLKYSLAAGLLSTGIQVYVLKRMTMSMTRQMVMPLQVHGAIHIVVDKDTYSKVEILFIDNYGIDIDKTVERNIEERFIREDFRRVENDEFRKIISLSDTVEYYSRSLVKRLKVYNLKNQKHKIIVGTKNNLIRAIMKKILLELKANVQVYISSKNLLELREEVLSTGANLGVYISHEGDSAILVDEKGNIIKEEAYEALKGLILLKLTKLKTLVVPVTSSGLMEGIARMCGVNFIRTKTSQKSILEAYIKNEKNLNRKEIINSYLIMQDAIGVVILTLKLIADSKVTLSEIISQFPKYYNKSQEILCPWDMKGKVMRNLIEQNSSVSVELIEGVKLNYTDAWALISPDDEKPICRVYAEAKNSADVEKISKELVNKIQELVGIDLKR